MVLSNGLVGQAGANEAVGPYNVIMKSYLKTSLTARNFLSFRRKIFDFFRAFYSIAVL
jgi:hypothetical protein